MKNIFKFVADQIVEHVGRIISESNIEGCNLMLLVGGFSESPIVQKVMRERFQTEERRIIVPNEAGLSVVKGAAIAGHAFNIVKDRVVRYNYGVDKMVLFDSAKHSNEYKYVDKGGTVWATNIFDVFMKKNTQVKEGTVISKAKVSYFFDDNIYTEVFAASRDVKFVNEDGCVKLCKIHIYNEELKPYIGKKLNYQYRFIFGLTEIEIEVYVEQTKTKFTASVEI